MNQLPLDHKFHILLRNQSTIITNSFHFKHTYNMQSVNQTLRKARELDQRFKSFMTKKEEQDKSMEETLRKIDRTQATIQETKNTIGSIDKLYERLEKVLNQSINAAVASIEKNTLLNVAQPGFQPNRVDAKKVAQMLKDKKKIMVLTGAGISAASGIPTFRGDGGFWRKDKVQIDPNELPQEIDPTVLLTLSFYSQHPQKTWQWLRNFYEIKAKAKPNKGHLALSEILQNLRGKNKQVCIVTQNIDNFHPQVKKERLSKNKNFKDYQIYQIHGNILKIRCNHCSINNKKLCVQPYQSYIDILQMKSKLHCPKCEGPLRPHVMFFDQFYDEVFNQSDTVNKFLDEADAVLVIGTALQTGLANSIVQKSIQTGKQVVQINTACQIKKSAVWWMQAKADQTLEAIKLQLSKK